MAELESQLLTACKNGHLRVVKNLVNNKKVSLLCRNENGNTPLHLTCLYRHIGLVRFLAVDKKCDVESRNNDGNTPLHCAAERGYLNILKVLVDDIRCDPTIKGYLGRTPLHSACNKGHLHIARYLIDEVHVNPLCRDGDLGLTPLHLASQFGYTEIVRYLAMEKKIDAECTDNIGTTPLHFAAACGRLDTVKVLVDECHCDPMCKGPYGRTPLHDACQEGHLNVVQYLIDEHNVDIHQDTNNVIMTPLHMAAKQGHTEVVKYLVGVKKCYPAPRSRAGKTPYDWARDKGHMDIALYLEGQGGGPSGAQKPHPTIPDSPTNTASASTSPPQESDREPLDSIVRSLMPYWYRPNITRDEAIDFVRHLDPGAFIVRDSQTVSGGYALTIKVSEKQVRNRRRLVEGTPVTEDMCAPQFLIQPDPEGVQLRGWNERAFKSLPEFIAQHTVEKMCLPCKLVLPKAGPVKRRPATMREALVTEAAETISTSERVVLASPISVPQQQATAIAEAEQPIWAVERDEITLTEEIVGRGGWGVVMVANFRGTRVAAKCLYSMIASDYNRRLFIREMNIAAKVRHPNLLQFIAATIRGDLIILTELMPTSLRAVLERGPISYQQTISISLDITRALNYLHLMRPRPIIHRDLSSGNVLLEPGPNNTWRAKVSDYGSANFLQQLRTTGPGNPNYAAPEAFNPYQQSPKMDIFSFGILLVEMCTDSFPDADSREELIQSITGPRMVGLIRECTVEERDKRPSAAEIMARLSEL